MHPRRLRLARQISERYPALARRLGLALSQRFGARHPRTPARLLPKLHLWHRMVSAMKSHKCSYDQCWDTPEEILPVRHEPSAEHFATNSAPVLRASEYLHGRRISERRALGPYSGALSGFIDKIVEAATGLEDVEIELGGDWYPSGTIWIVGWRRGRQSDERWLTEQLEDEERRERARYEELRARFEAPQ